MANLYADENFSKRVVKVLRDLGHDVLTAAEDGKANLGIPDDQVVKNADSLNRIILTFNRRHFIRLHQENSTHPGIIVCTTDPDPDALAKRIHAMLENRENFAGQLIRINRPNEVNQIE